MKVFIKILKIILGIILGLLFSLLTIVGLDAILPSENPFSRSRANLWLLAVIIAGWTFIFLWLMMRWKTTMKGIQTEGIDSLPLSISELIDGIIDAMKYRRSVRAEVRQELTDHFTDALRNVEDEQERQKQAEELIREFGDAKLLAVLIRRGKKRCRPMWQKALIHCFQAVCILCLLLILYIGWFFTGKPVITTDYVAQLNQLVRPVAEDSQNAWPLYKEATVEYKMPNLPDANSFKLSPQKLTYLDNSQRQIIEKWIADNQKAMELIRLGTERQYYWRTYTTEKINKETVPSMIGIITPNLIEYKRLAQLFCWEAYFKSEKGEHKEAFDQLVVTYNFGRHIRMQNGNALIEQLTGFGIEGMACKCMIDLLSEYVVNADILGSVQKEFAAVRVQENFTVNFQSEKLLLYDEIQRCYTHDRVGKEHLYVHRLEGINPNIRWEKLLTMQGVKGGLWVLFAHPDRQDTVNSANQLYTLYDELTVTTPAALRTKLPKFRQQAEDILMGNVIIGSLVPSVERICDYSWEFRTSSLAAETILSLFRYKQEKGSFPVSLEALIKEGYLNEIPLDPYSDKPLVYRRTEDRFTLYSVGFNFTDDGGVRGTNNNGKPIDWGQNGDFVFWPVQK
jgi:hypothetical protein